MLEGLAYRMLGTLADARDLVQDTYLKWRDAKRDEIRDPRAWLVTVCSRYAASHVVIRVAPRWFNGGPGFLLYENDRLATALSVSVEDGMTRRLYAHRNPEKLGAFLA